MHRSTRPGGYSGGRCSGGGLGVTLVEELLGDGVNHGMPLTLFWCMVHPWS